MDLPFGNEISNQFITSIGLITTHGSHGHNIMACEWTHHISYHPGMIAVSVNPKHATYEQIKSAGEFGIGICASDQNILASVAGKASGRNVHKIKILEELGFKFYTGKMIGAMMVEGTAANFECKLVKELELGDHTMFVGEVLHAEHTPGKGPLVYHGGSYWKLETNVEKPLQETRDKIKSLFEMHKKI